MEKSKTTERRGRARATRTILGCLLLVPILPAAAEPSGSESPPAQVFPERGKGDSPISEEAASKSSPASRWTLFAFGQGFLGVADEARFEKPSGDGVERTAQGVSNGSAVGLGVEYRLSRRTSLELSLFFGDLDVDFRLEAPGGAITDSGRIGTKGYTLGAKIHLTPDLRADIYAGPFATLIFFDDIIFLSEIGRRDKFSYDDDLGFGARLGVDLPLGDHDRWSVFGEIGYLTAILESEQSEGDLDLNPWLPLIGVSYRF